MSITVISANPRLSIWLSFMFLFFPFNCLFNIFPCIFCFVCPQYLVSFIWKKSYNNSLCPILDTSAFFFYHSLPVYVTFILFLLFTLLSIIYSVLTVNIISCLIAWSMFDCIFLSIHFLLNSLIHGLSIDRALSDTKVRKSSQILDLSRHPVWV